MVYVYSCFCGQSLTLKYIPRNIRTCPSCGSHMEYEVKKDSEEPKTTTSKRKSKFKRTKH